MYDLPFSVVVRCPGARKRLRAADDWGCLVVSLHADSPVLLLYVGWTCCMEARDDMVRVSGWGLTVCDYSVHALSAERRERRLVAVAGALGRHLWPARPRAALSTLPHGRE
jgi:hypothetical protein